MFWKKNSNIGRYTRVESWLGRGGQPTGDGYKMLAHYGFKTIVNLRHKKDKVPKALRERLRVIDLPVKNHGIPAIEQVVEWLGICADPANHPIFVHCEAGKGRTSTFVGIVRLAQGYPIDEVISEGVSIFDFPESEVDQIQFLRRLHEMAVRGEVALPRLPGDPKNATALNAAELTSAV